MRGSRGRTPTVNPSGGWHPEQLLTLEETLRGFTAGSAYAAFAEDRLGILKPGFRADLTVVDRDLFEVKPEELLASKVIGYDHRRQGRVRTEEQVKSAATLVLPASPIPRFQRAQ